MAPCGASWKRTLLILSIKDLTFVEQIQHESLWWRNGFIAASLCTSLPQVCQWANNTHLTIANTTDKGTNDFPLLGMLRKLVLASLLSNISFGSCCLKYRNLGEKMNGHPKRQRWRTLCVLTYNFG